ncbi:head maturation protease, ClpP-related [Lactiplantibacillus paraxiangfangensis]|uniref:head maturation protease, ClpP-related n=1 Tax=Lactiplantibacillus paraxiangfangensis TaxID=3076224 RepID=UPI0030C77CCC
MKKINIKGPIISNDDSFIYKMFGIDGTCPKDVIDALPADGSDVEIDINSGGGYVDEGREIYTALKSYAGKVTVNIVGRAASSASVIAMAGNPTKISPIGQIMIHNVAGGIYGDYRDQAKLSDVLKQMNESMATAYQLKTGLPMDDLLAKMNEETYLNADQAKELGFVDEIMFSEGSEELDLVADDNSGMLPKSAIEKIKELLKQNDSEPKLTENDITRISDSVAKKLTVKTSKQAGKLFNPFAF